MKENIEKLIEAYNIKSINLGELYSELLKIKRSSDSSFEKILRNTADSFTMWLLLTYQNSKTKS